MSLFDDVVVVRDVARAGVLELRPARGDAAREPRRVEADLVVTTLAGHLLDVPVEHHLTCGGGGRREDETGLLVTCRRRPGGRGMQTRRGRYPRCQGRAYRDEYENAFHRFSLRDMCFVLRVCAEARRRAMGRRWALGGISAAARSRAASVKGRSPNRRARRCVRSDRPLGSTKSNRQLGVSRMHAHVWHHHQRAIAPFEYRAPSPFAPLLALLVVGAIIAFFFFMIVMPVD